jgi:hypothetical protein
MHQTDSDGYVWFQVHFSIVCTQYGSHFMWPCCHLDLELAVRFFKISSPFYNTKFISSVAEDCVHLSADCATCIWFVTMHKCHFLFEGVLRIWNLKYPIAYWICYNCFVYISEPGHISLWFILCNIWALDSSVHRILSIMNISPDLQVNAVHVLCLCVCVCVSLEIFSV